MTEYLTKHLEQQINPLTGSFADIRYVLSNLELDYSLWNDLKIECDYDVFYIKGWQRETKVDVYIRNKYNEWQYRENAKRLHDLGVLEKQIADYIADPNAPYPEGVVDIHTKDMLHKIKKQRILEERK
jgi:hypothetical protein